MTLKALVLLQPSGFFFKKKKHILGLGRFSVLPKVTQYECSIAQEYSK